MSYTKGADNFETYDAQNIVGNRYARDSDGQSYYPKKGNDEVMDQTLGLIERNGEYVYPLKEDGNPNYRTEAIPGGNKTKQVYEKVGEKWIIGKNKNGDQVYAKDENNNDTYPEDYTPAKKADGSMIYALDANGVTIFPKKDGEEIYLSEVDEHKQHTIPTKYITVKGNQIYPQKITLDGLKRDYIIGQAYAMKAATPYYPKDAYNNEFYSGTNTPAQLLENYAVTNDGKVILPTVNNSHYIDATKIPAVQEADVIGSLFREINNTSDHLTKVDSTVKPTGEKRVYKYRSKRSGIVKTIAPAGAVASTRVASGAAAVLAIPYYKTWYFWVLVIVSLVLKAFAAWWFFFRNPPRMSTVR